MDVHCFYFRNVSHLLKSKMCNAAIKRKQLNATSFHIYELIFCHCEQITCIVKLPFEIGFQVAIKLHVVQIPFRSYSTEKFVFFFCYLSLNFVSIIISRSRHLKGSPIVAQRVICNLDFACLMVVIKSNCARLMNSKWHEFSEHYRDLELERVKGCT